MESEDGNVLLVVLLMLVTVIILVAGGVFLYQKYQQNQTESIKKDVYNTVQQFHPEAQLSQKQENKPQIVQEPVVPSWKLYESPVYKFKMEVPSGWYEMDYPGPKVFNGTIAIKFSPTSLPDKSTYPAFVPFYLLVSIFPISHVEEYGNYQSQLAKIGRDAGFSSGSLGGEKGYKAPYGVYAAHRDFVYGLELSEDKGNIQDSSIYQHILSSFMFTD